MVPIGRQDDLSQAIVMIHFNTSIINKKKNHRHYETSLSPHEI
jgi:hypothetical protein